MRYMLDTHTFIWWDGQTEKLSKRVYDLCNTPTNTLLLSLVSLWEIQIKLQTGKLILRQPLENIVREHQQENDIQILPLSLPHVLALQNLPLHHKDPFDHMLIAQAMTEKATLLSKDSRFRLYNTTVIW